MAPGCTVVENGSGGNGNRGSETELSGSEMAGDDAARALVGPSSSRPLVICDGSAGNGRSERRSVRCGGGGRSIVASICTRWPGIVMSGDDSPSAPTSRAVLFASGIVRSAMAQASIARYEASAMARGLSDSDLGLLLERTSRTFALAIPLLPPKLARSVGAAYLLFRIADTLEDATKWDRERRLRGLDAFLSWID